MLLGSQFIVGLVNVGLRIGLVVLLVAAIIWLQFYLSKKNNKWLGLILPAFCLFFAIISVLNVSTFNSLTISQMTTDSNGLVLEESQEVTAHQQVPWGEMLVRIMTVFAVSNIPTVFFLLIYFGCRKQYKQKNELDKMNIQDLE